MHPVLQSLARKAPKGWVRRLRYRHEDRLAHGRQHVPAGAPPSRVLFTTHKCASTYLVQLARIVSADMGLTPVDLAAYFWDAGDASVSVAQQLRQGAQELFVERGYLYAPLRRYVATTLHPESSILVLRDPRDVLVSGYFSARFSHRPPLDAARQVAFEQHRRQLQTTGLDDYVLGRSAYLLSVYDEYIAHIPRSQLLRYELLWADLPEFLRRMAGLLGTELSMTAQAQLERRFRAGRPAAENVHSHRRKGTPGDYASKLNPSTIATLNAQWSPVLEWMRD